MKRIQVPLRCEGRGEYDFIIHGGKRGTVVVPGSRNLILTAGWDRLLTQLASVVSWCQVGTGNATPLVSDTQLQARYAGTSTTVGSFTNTYVAGTPDYIESVRTFRFAEGSLPGVTLGEVGVGWASTGSLFSRARISVAGAPGTITVLADETLDVVFRFRLYPIQTDVTGSVTLNGVVTNYTIRPASINDTFVWQPSLMLDAPLFSFTQTPSGSDQGNQAYSGAIGSRTSVPAGSQVGSTTTTNTITPQAYTNGTAQRARRYLWSLNDINNASVGVGFRSLRVDHKNYANGQSYCRYQVEFSPNVDKRSTMKLEIDFVFSFANRP